MEVPMPGRVVNIVYKEIDEIEVKCWLMEFKTVGFMDNNDMKITKNDLDKRDLAIIKSVDLDGRIELQCLRA